MELEAKIAKILTITSVEAVELKNGKFRIDAIFANGEREILKEKSNKKPLMVQALRASRANGNYRGDGIGACFIFSKSVPSYCKELFVKGFVVA